MEKIYLFTGKVIVNYIIADLTIATFKLVKDGIKNRKQKTEKNEEIQELEELEELESE